MSEWQDISTAPKWWKTVILHDPEADPPVFEGYFSGEPNDEEGRWRESGNPHLHFAPTHWQPLPAPPKPNDLQSPAQQKPAE